MVDKTSDNEQWLGNQLATSQFNNPAGYTVSATSDFANNEVNSAVLYKI